jgi:hypothetical protein
MNGVQIMHTCHVQCAKKCLIRTGMKPRYSPFSNKRNPEFYAFLRRLATHQGGRAGGEKTEPSYVLLVQRLRQPLYTGRESNFSETATTSKANADPIFRLGCLRRVAGRKVWGFEPTRVSVVSLSPRSTTRCTGPELRLNPLRLHVHCGPMDTPTVRLRTTRKL